MPLFNTPNITLKLFTFFFIWHIVQSYPTSIEFCINIFFRSKSKILFCLNCSILCSYQILIFVLFARDLDLCFNSSITVFNLLLYFYSVAFIQFPQFTFFLPFQYSFYSLSRKLTSCSSLFISLYYSYSNYYYYYYDDVE